VFPAKGGDGVVIRMLVGGQVTKGNVVVGCALDAAGTGDTRAVAVEQQACQQQRMIHGKATAILPHVFAVDGRQIEFVGHIGDEAGQVTFRQPIL
jgi:hypothetical protein